MNIPTQAETGLEWATCVRQARRLGWSAPFLRCHLSRLQIILRGNAKGISYAIKKCEHGRDVDGLRDLIFFPACFSQLLNILGG